MIRQLSFYTKDLWLDMLPRLPGIGKARDPILFLEYI